MFSNFLRLELRYIHRLRFAPYAWCYLICVQNGFPEQAPKSQWLASIFHFLSHLVAGDFNPTIATVLILIVL